MHRLVTAPMAPMEDPWSAAGNSDLILIFLAHNIFTFLREALHIFYPTNVRGDRLFMVSLFFRYVAPALHCISSESEIHPPMKSKSFDISLQFTSFLKRITDVGVNLFLGRGKQ